MFDLLEQEPTYSCLECGGPMQITEFGVSNHVDENGGIDFDLDADHVAVADEAYGITR